MGKLQELNKRDYNHISGGVQSRKKKATDNSAAAYAVATFWSGVNCCRESCYLGIHKIDSRWRGVL